MSAIRRLANSFVRSSGLLLSVVFVFSSCQPKDIDLRGAQAANQFSGKDPKASIMSASESNTILAVTMERAFEPLYLLRAKLDSEFASQQDLKVENSTKPADTDELSVGLLESVIAKEGTVLKRNTNTTSSLSYTIDEFSIDAGGKLRKFVLNKNIFKETTQKALRGKDDFKSQSYSEKMTIYPSADENIYVIKLSRTDSTDSKKDKKSLIKTETKIKIIWDGQKSSLNQPLQVLYIEADVKRELNKTGEIKIYDAQPMNLTVQLGSCISINGTFKINTTLDADQKMINPDQIVISDSSFEFPSKQKSTALPCESRPVVDLARLL